MTPRERRQRIADRYYAAIKKSPSRNWQAIGFTQAPLVPLIRCTMPKPCGQCWYCQQHEAKR